MTLSEKDIRHIAGLARLELTDQEIKQYRTELGGILRYVDELQHVQIKKDFSPVFKEVENKLRLDSMISWPEDEQVIALKQAYDRKGRLIKVKRILN